MQNSDGRYEPSRVYHGDDAIENKKARLSESARVDRDDIVRQVEKRARRFQGWRGNSTKLQPPMTQRYTEGGFFDYHYDFDELIEKGNRVTTFMVYLADNCTGGGTNFPRLEWSGDRRWCNVIDCDNDEYLGVTFKPVAGSAVFWENMHPNGSFHHGVAHASLPLLSGTKVGLNLWFWDSEWRRPKE